MADIYLWETIGIDQFNLFLNDLYFSFDTLLIVTLEELLKMKRTIAPVRFVIIVLIPHNIVHKFWNLLSSLKIDKMS